MKSSHGSLRPLLILVSLASGSLCVEGPCHAAEKPQLALLAAEVKALETKDFGVQSEEQAERFGTSIFAMAAEAGLQVASTSRVSSNTNAFFCERRQLLAIQATEKQLLDFLGYVGASNSVLRVQALSLRPSPDRARLQASVSLVGSYRLKSTGQPQVLPPLENEYLVLNQRRILRFAALDCYTVTRNTLPPLWTLDALNFEDGKRVSLHGQAPADQVRSLEEVRTSLQKAKGRDGEELFQPSGADATMRLADSATNFSWSIQLELRPAESR